jgi:hypothetical protein
VRQHEDPRGGKGSYLYPGELLKQQKVDKESNDENLRYQQSEVRRRRDREVEFVVAEARDELKDLKKKRRRLVNRK